MKPSESNLFGVKLTELTQSHAVAAVLQRAKQGQGGAVTFANVHTIVTSMKAPALRECFDQAFMNCPDGLPLVWASRLLKLPIGGRICGPDFMREAIETWKAMPMGFVGGAPGVADTLCRNFSLNAPCYKPPMRPFSGEAVREDWENFTKLCNGATPPVVWVGLGAPKQELWANAASRLAPHTVFLAVGAAFDFLSGNKKRAPLWMQRIGLEWLFRLMEEPGRLFWRYFSTNLYFVWRVGIALLAVPFRRS